VVLAVDVDDRPRDAGFARQHPGEGFLVAVLFTAKAFPKCR
jgi:hypothetical protein